MPSAASLATTSKNSCCASNVSRPSISTSAARRAARAAPRRIGDVGHVRGRVFFDDEPQAAGGDDLLVVVDRHEEKEPDRAARPDVRARERPGDHHGIGEEQPAAGLQHTRALADHARPVGQMVDRVDAGHRVEAMIGEGQRLLRVRALELRPPREPAFGGERLCRRDRLVVHVDADHGAARGRGDPERRSAGAARDVEQRPARPEDSDGG